MNYKMEELVPIVAKLAEEYTAGESTTITYEKAQQLMEAVIYSIHEGEGEESFSLMEQGDMPAKMAYDIGLKCVEKKTKETLALYNEPQNTILTLDYPVLVDNPKCSGIDRIHDYVLCIQLEQRFLNKFSNEYVVEVLSRYNRDYRLMIDNISEVILMNLIFSILTGKGAENMTFEPQEYKRVQTMLQKEDLNTLREKLKSVINVIIQKYYENDEQLMEYLSHAIDSISVRVKTAADQ